MASCPNDFKKSMEPFNPLLLGSSWCIKKLWGGRNPPFPTISVEPLETELQTKLRDLLQQQVAYQCLKEEGRNNRTASVKVLQQVAEWLHIPHALSMNQNAYVKDQLLQLLSKGIREKI
ncbi:hypothetical protein TNCT_707281 [Trichonephila clavata]|uniref:Uncharacterized protein n=1 Tax=Trichonephila clavata TaxID=2740835 RepID=A0A8X6HVE2_TRICU|nr:hypothetical protein TNCT_707281 [Trichonephila clavata]